MLTRDEQKGIHCLHGRAAGGGNLCHGRPPQPAFDSNWRVLVKTQLYIYNRYQYFNILSILFFQR